MTKKSLAEAIDRSSHFGTDVSITLIWQLCLYFSAKPCLRSFVLTQNPSKKFSCFVSKRAKVSEARPIVLSLLSCLSQTPGIDVR